MAQLVVDPALSEQMRREGIAAQADLSALERERLLHVACDPGLAVNHTLHRGFRLGKIKALLPLTTTLLQGAPLQTALERFWARHPRLLFPARGHRVLWLSAGQPTRSKYLQGVAALRAPTSNFNGRASTRRPRKPCTLPAPAICSASWPPGTEARPAPSPCGAVGSLDGKGDVRWALRA
ncbi:MAG: hypothetical protein R3E42_14755 [Burkholderiaceae bacterium]